MNQKRMTRWLLAALLLTVQAAAALADNTLTIADITICQGETKDVTIMMNTAQTAYGAQADLSLPAGLDVVAGSLKASDGRTGMQAVQSRIDGGWRFGFTGQGKEIGGSGELATFRLTADKELAAGEYTIGLSRMKVNVGNASTVPLSGEVKVTVTEVPALSDVRFSAVETAMTVSPGVEYDVQVTLHNSAPTMNRISSFSGAIVLPEGLGIVGEPVKGSRLPDGAELELNTSNNRFMLWPAEGTSISGEDGVIFTFRIKATKEMAGNSEIRLTAIEVSDANANSAAIPDVVIGLTMAVPEAVITAPTAAEGLVYSGEAQALVAAGEASGGELRYSLDGKDYSTEIPTGTDAGDYTVYYMAEGDENHSDADGGSVAVRISKAPLKISAGTYTRKQGEENPAFTVAYEGFKNGETAEVLTKQPVLGCEATADSAPGEYAVTVTGAEAANYEISYASGTLTVTEAEAVVITAKSYSRAYGAENPVFEYTVTGATLEGQPEISCEATATSPVGEYPIIIKKGSVTNYNDSYVAGTLTITKAPLKISAGTYTRKQGGENPTFTVAYEGFVNGETEAVLTKQPTVSCEATKESAPGEYEVTVTGAEAENYEISYAPGKLTVTEAEAVIIPGDINNNGMVDDEDVDAFIELYLGDQVPEAGDAEFRRFDANGDGEITMADAVAIFYLSNGLNFDGTDPNAARAGEPMDHGKWIIDNDCDLTMEATELGNGIVRYTLTSDFEYAGFAVDVKGAQVVGESAEGMTLRSADTKGKHRIVAYNFEQAAAAGTVLTVDVLGKAEFPNINFSDANARNIRFSLSETTGIGATSMDNGKRIMDHYYDLSGQRLSGKPTRSSVYVKNGKKVLVGDKR